MILTGTILTQTMPSHHIEKVESPLESDLP